MGTSLIFAKFSNKRVSGFNDFGLRMLTSLRTLNRESVQARFDVDGVFNTPHGLSGGVDTVTVTGSERSTDGLGNTIQVAASEAGPSALFENTNAIVYDVGVRVAEVETGILVNPRTGLPEYLATKEEIGEKGAPDLVTDNGSTITFRVDSVTEAGVSNAGRIVRVYKVIPSTNATTAAVAIEDLVVSFGANNTVTSTGLFGQTAVSTTPADYVVVMLGVSVRRNTDLEASAQHLFIGQVTGVGAGGTPTVFNTANQRLLKTFTDASQVIFAPFQWLTTTNVQAALQQVVTVLGDSGSSDPGASRLGLDATAFSKALPSAVADPSGGLGTIADGTYPVGVKAQELLQGIDAALKRRRAWTASFAGADRAGGGDFAGGALAEAGVMRGTLATGGAWFAQQTSVAYPYKGATALSASVGPYVLGESAGGPDGLSRTPVDLDDNTSASELLAGKWQRVGFASSAAAAAGLRSRGNLSLEDVRVKSGMFLVGGQAEGDSEALSVNRSIFQSADHEDFSGGLTVGSNDNDGVVWGSIANCLISGTSPASASIFVEDTSATISEGTNYSKQRVLTFRNCHITSEDLMPLLSDDFASGLGYRITFEGCTFISDITGVDLLIDFRTVGTTFRNCVFNDLQGRGVRLRDCIIDGCEFRYGENAAAGSNPCLELVSCCVSNTKQIISANPGTNRLFQAQTGTSLTNFEMAVEGSFQLADNVFAAVLLSSCYVNNVDLDVNECLPGSVSGAHLFQISETQGAGLTLAGLPSGIDGNNTGARLVDIDQFCTISDLTIRVANSGFTDNSGGFRVSQSQLSNVRLTLSVDLHASGGGIFEIEDSTIHGMHVVNGTASLKSDTSGNAGIELRASRVTGLVYAEQTQTAIGGAMVELREVVGELIGSQLIGATLNGGFSSGAFVGQVVEISGDRCIMQGCIVHWSPDDNSVGREAVQISGNDVCMITGNTFFKDLASAAAGTNNIIDTGAGTGNVVTPNTFSEA